MQGGRGGAGAGSARGVTTVDVLLRVVANLGGGYAGAMAANRPTQRDDVTVTPINPRPAFVDRARSCNKVAGGSHDAVVDYREIPGEGDFAVVDGTLIPAAAHTLLTCPYTERKRLTVSRPARVPRRIAPSHPLRNRSALRRGATAATIDACRDE